MPNQPSLLSDNVINDVIKNQYRERRKIFEMSHKLVKDSIEYLGCKITHTLDSFLFDTDEITVGKQYTLFEQSKCHCWHLEAGMRSRFYRKFKQALCGSNLWRCGTIFEVRVYW